MKKINLVGGVGWLATAQYYEGIHRAARTPNDPLLMTIESLDMSSALALSRCGTEDAGSPSTLSTLRHQPVPDNSDRSPFKRQFRVDDMIGERTPERLTEG